MSTQWTIPRSLSTSVIPTSSRSWRNAKPFCRNAEPQREASRHLGLARSIGKRYCKSGVFFRLFIRKGFIRGFPMCQNTHTSPHVASERQTQTQPCIRDASQDRQPVIHSNPVREDLQRIMVQTNNNCRFQIFISTNSLHQQRLFAGR